MTSPYDFPDDFRRAVEAAIARYERIGVVTIDQLNEFLPSDQVTSDAIEEVYGLLTERGIDVIE